MSERRRKARDQRDEMKKQVQELRRRYKHAKKVGGRALVKELADEWSKLTNGKFVTMLAYPAFLRSSLPCLSLQLWTCGHLQD